MVLRGMIKKNFVIHLKTAFESSLFPALGVCKFRTMILHQRPLTTIYDALSLTHSTLLTADIILCLLPIDDFLFLFLIIYYNPLLSL
jgi:hypothetical protein